jgi:hypothetical protein
MALAAPQSFAPLYRQVAAALEIQQQAVACMVAASHPRDKLLRALDLAIQQVGSGLVQLDAPAGAGVTTLLCHAATLRPWLLWLPEYTHSAGLAALCAQLIALYHLPLALVPPTASRDTATLEQLLAEAADRRPDAAEPIVVLVDQFPRSLSGTQPVLLPTRLPPGVVLVRGGPLEHYSPPPAARVVMTADPSLSEWLGMLADQAGCPPERRSEVIAHSAGSGLYVQIISELLQQPSFRSEQLPPTLIGLFQLWWKRLDSAGRRLVQALAVANEPIESALLLRVTGVSDESFQRFLRRWSPWLRIEQQRICLRSTSLRELVSTRSGNRLQDLRGAFVKLALDISNGQLTELLHQPEQMLTRQIAQQIALGGPATLPLAIELVSRSWISVRQRQTNDLRGAFRDAGWALQAAAREGLPARLVRIAILTGSLATLQRSLQPNSLAEAFERAINQGEPRDNALRLARRLLDQLPDTRDKATLLRQLGEVCHEQRMRASAMRMLAEALDLEVAGQPRSWREAREDALVALARTALSHSEPDIALGITVRINHIERRGLIETEVVRALIGDQQLTRAEEVAYAIGHESMHEWAMAEVAVAQARGGNRERAAMVISTLKTATAAAWAQAELATDQARSGDRVAIEQVAAIPSERLRDRGLASVAMALAEINLTVDALAATSRIGDRETRMRTLLDMAEQYPQLAPEALARARSELPELGDDRLPLVVALAAACASAGAPIAALRVAETLEEGEERDRADSRVAVALAARGDYSVAQTIAAAIPDDDERDWTYHEIVRLVSDELVAQQLLEQIVDPEVFNRALASRAIELAHTGNLAAALTTLDQIALPREKLRAAQALARPCIAANQYDAALDVIDQFAKIDDQSRYCAALALAFAAQGDRTAARHVVLRIARPLDRMRAWLGIARAALEEVPDEATAALGEALNTAAPLGRPEMLQCLTQAADILVALAGSDVLLMTAHVLDETDEWWW